MSKREKLTWCILIPTIVMLLYTSSKAPATSPDKHCGCISKGCSYTDPRDCVACCGIPSTCRVDDPTACCK